MNWNYDEFAEKLAMGRIDVDGAEIPLVLEEDKARYLELAKESAKKRFGFARQKLAAL